MNKLLKLLGLVECFMCSNIVFIWNTKWGYFTDDPTNDIGYKERICKGCAETWETKARG